MSSSAQGVWRPHKPAVGLTPGEGIDIYGNTITNTGVVGLDGIAVDNTNPSIPTVLAKVVEVRAGSNISVNSVDPLRPIVSATGSPGLVEGVVAGSGISVDSTDPEYPVVTNTGVRSVVAGASISVNNTDPYHPIIANNGVRSVVAGAGIAVNVTDPRNPIVSATGGGGGGGTVQSVVAGTGIAVDSTDPANPIVSATGGGSGGTVDTVVAGAGITVDSTDPANPVVTNSGVRTVAGGDGISINNTDPVNPVISVVDPVSFTSPDNSLLLTPSPLTESGTIQRRWIGWRADLFPNDVTQPGGRNVLAGWFCTDVFGLYDNTNYPSTYRSPGLNDPVSGSFIIPAGYVGLWRIQAQVLSDNPDMRIDVEAVYSLTTQRFMTASFPSGSYSGISTGLAQIDVVILTNNLETTIRLFTDKAGKVNAYFYPNPSPQPTATWINISYLGAP